MTSDGAFADGLLHQKARTLIMPGAKYALGSRVTKAKGSSWTGLVVGYYSTALTPIGYCIESENEPGSVQIYPEAALMQLRVKG